AMDAYDTGIDYRGDTIYLATADDSGLVVSFINSLYMGFGSGIVVPGTGVKLQNRGNLFSLDSDHPNKYEPNKRPFHTIIPAILEKNDSYYGAFGIMGGAHQAQAHAQFVSYLIDHDMSPQQAMDYPRFNHNQLDNTVALESGFPIDVYGQLQKKRHKISYETQSGFGGGQVIIRNKDIWVGGSDRRKDGQAAGF
ncbi:MAG: gamma-glutamyltransferase, partial [Candidatus Thorarchaeota archaeon]